MKKSEIMLWIRARAEKNVSIEDRHKQFVLAMSRLGPPFGFADIVPPLVPSCGSNLSADFVAKLSTRGVKMAGHYIFRGERYLYEDTAKFDDLVYIGFSNKNKNLDYHSILKNDFPCVIEAFQAYSATLAFDSFDSAYMAGVEPSEDGETFFDETGYEVRNNQVYNALAADPSVDVDGRNNIYVLRPAQYWDSELCHRALGYGPDELISRLQGTEAEARRMMDGVYLVLDSNPDLMFENFLEINKVYKPLLGLR